MSLRQKPAVLPTFEEGADSDDSDQFCLPAETPTLMGLHSDFDELHRFEVWRKPRHGRSRLQAVYHGRMDSEYEPWKTWESTNKAALKRWLDKKWPVLGGASSGSYEIPQFAESRQNSRGTPLVEKDGEVAAEIRTTSRQDFYQFPDGSGLVEYHGEPFLVRTRNGLLLKSSDDLKRIAGQGWWWYYNYPAGSWGRSLSGYRNEMEVDHFLSLSNLEDMDGVPPLRDIVRVEEAEDSRNTYVHFASGERVVIVPDPTAAEWGARKAGFLVEDETEQFPPVGEAEKLLMPSRVLRLYEQGWDILTSDQYAGRGGDFRHGGTGDHIVRQGEWYLVPKPADWEPDAPIFKMLPKPYRVSNWELGHLDMADSPFTSVDGVTDGLPSSCDACGATSFDVKHVPVAECADCGRSVLYRAASHVSDTLDADIKQSFEDAKETLGSHKARDLTFDGGGTPTVRGTFRHIEGEHRMLNLGERWHEAHENTRDVTVFDTRRGNYASAGSGNGMRVE